MIFFVVDVFLVAPVIGNQILVSRGGGNDVSISA